MSGTMETVEADADVLDPELLLVVSLIDNALTEVAHRSIVSADEMADLLLDIRAAALALRR